MAAQAVDILAELLVDVVGGLFERQVDAVGFLDLATDVVAIGAEDAVRIDQADRLEGAQARRLEGGFAAQVGARKGDQGAIVGKRRTGRPAEAARAAVVGQKADDAAVLAEDGDMGVRPHSGDGAGEFGRQQGRGEGRRRLCHFAPQGFILGGEVLGFDEGAVQHWGRFLKQRSVASVASARGGPTKPLNAKDL